MDKQAVRERIWDELEESGVARFPYPPHGRIPNFEDATGGADRLAETADWQEADVVKSNPDAPQLPVRRRALAEGKVVYMAVPRLRDEQCFLRLDPAEIEDTDHAATLGGSDELGVQIGPGEMEPVELIVAGSVAVDESGGRIGKGEGYSDLEFGVLREFDLVDDGTTTVTTVHEKQVVQTEVATTPRDVPLDVVVTPERTIRTGGGPKPDGIDWAALDEERLAEIPILSRLSPESS